MQNAQLLSHRQTRERICERGRKVEFAGTSAPFRGRMPEDLAQGWEGLSSGWKFVTVVIGVLVLIPALGVAIRIVFLAFRLLRRILVPSHFRQSAEYLDRALAAERGHGHRRCILCRKSFLDDMGMGFARADEIAPTGSKVKQNGADLILVRKVAKGSDTFVLRDEKGGPV
jgi:hypothetical protein